MSAGAIDPAREAWELFKSLPRDQPIQMLNLIRFKELADYPEDHPDHGKGITGAEAYAAYGAAGGPVVNGLGGRQVWAGKPEVTLIGPPDEKWDLAFIIEYPDAKTFIGMLMDKTYAEHTRHRTAAVADSRLIRLSPQVSTAYE